MDPVYVLCALFILVIVGSAILDVLTIGKGGVPRMENPPSPPPEE